MQEEGPWFWGRAGCFITPWTFDFDSNHSSITITPVWVKLLNLPMHLWSILSLRAIGNSLGKYLKTDIEQAKRGLATYARICIKVDLSEGLLDQIILSWKSQKWVQMLDYENTTFWCRSCWQTRHLHGSCPLSHSSRKKSSNSKAKRWNDLKLPFSSYSKEEENITQNLEVHGSVDLRNLDRFDTLP